MLEDVEGRKKLTYADVVLIKHAWVLEKDIRDCLDVTFLLQGAAFEITDVLNNDNEEMLDTITHNSIIYHITYEHCSYEWLVDSHKAQVLISVRIVRNMGLYIMLIRPAKGWVPKTEPNTFSNFLHEAV